MVNHQYSRINVHCRITNVQGALTNVQSEIDDIQCGIDISCSIVKSNLDRPMSTVGWLIFSVA